LEEIEADAFGKKRGLTCGLEVGTRGGNVENKNRFVLKIFSKEQSVSKKGGSRKILTLNPEMVMRCSKERVSETRTTVCQTLQA